VTPIDACPLFEEIEGLAHGRLEEAVSSRISAHMTKCATCSKQLDELRSDRELGERLRRSLGGMNETTLPTIEGYGVVREVGRGGMGVVYEAEQLSPKRRVALKVVRGVQYVDAQTLRLFQREIRVLARLEHPGIASLYDAGETRGEHWFAMEFVDGKPLTLHARSLARAAKLERFLQLCDAIDHAHRHGVVHRDLKPSNVLVTDAGRVQVLDFGLAKITDADVSIATEAGHIRGTLAYMSPEQARGDPAAIGLSSDVYSLGVILYEILCNALPIDTSSVPIHEAARRVAMEAPRRPSAIVPSLRGDLETIIRKALEKDAHRRYATTAALAEDVRRYLANDVILARPPSSAYELSKPISRHKVPFALAAVVLVGAVATAAWTSILYSRESDLLAVQKRLSGERETTLEAEKDQRKAAEVASAEAQRQTALAEERLDSVNRETDAREAGLNFLVELFGDIGRSGDNAEALSAAELLKRGIARLNQRKDTNDTARMMILSSVGNAAMRAGLQDEAAKLLEEGVELARRDQPGEPVLASLLTSLGLLRDAQGRGAESTELLKEAEAIFSAKEGKASKNSLQARVNLAKRLLESGSTKRAAQIAREALPDAEGAPELVQKRLELQGIVGMGLYATQELAEGETFLLAAIAEHQDAGVSPGFAALLQTLGNVYYGMGRHGDARARMQAALDMRLAILSPDDEALAASYIGLAAIAKTTNDTTTALDLMAKATMILAARYGAGSLQVAMCEYNRSRILLQMKDAVGAKILAKHALDVRIAKFGFDSYRTAECWSVLGEIALQQQDTVGAEEAFIEALRIFDVTLGKPHLSTIQARFNLAQCLMAAKRFDEARSIMDEIQIAATSSKGMSATQVQAIQQLAKQVEAAAGPSSAETSSRSEAHELEPK